MTHGIATIIITVNMSTSVCMSAFYCERAPGDNIVLRTRELSRAGQKLTSVTEWKCEPSPAIESILYYFYICRFRYNVVAAAFLEFCSCECVSLSQSKTLYPSRLRMQLKIWPVCKIFYHYRPLLISYDVLMMHSCCQVRGVSHTSIASHNV